MRIAQIVPLHVSVPPTKYGGTERVVHNLTEALVADGHEVTLFATADSQTSARLVPMLERGIYFDATVDATAHHMAMLEHVYSRAHQFDVIHSHLDYVTLPYIHHTQTPTVITLHGRLDAPEHKRVFRASPGANYVSISDSQRRDLPDINYIATIHHGIDVASFPFSRSRGEYLAFVGRMSPEKRPDLAIEIACRVGIPLKIAAKIDDKERPYFKSTIQPLLKERRKLVEFVGEVDEQGKRELMRNALALLLPIDWPEPFGMVFSEALACGTPVITRPCGSAPELLKDNVTGYIASTADELVAAVRRVHRISRMACRQWAEERFDRRRMAADYERVYLKLLRSRTGGRRPIYSMPRTAAAARSAGILPAPDAMTPAAAQHDDGKMESVVLP